MRLETMAQNRDGESWGSFGKSRILEITCQKRYSSHHQLRSWSYLNMMCLDSRLPWELKLRLQVRNSVQRRSSRGGNYKARTRKFFIWKFIYLKSKVTSILVCLKVTAKPDRASGSSGLVVFPSGPVISLFLAQELTSSSQRTEREGEDSSSKPGLLRPPFMGLYHIKTPQLSWSLASDTSCPVPWGWESWPGRLEQSDPPLLVSQRGKQSWIRRKLNKEKI